VIENLILAVLVSVTVWLAIRHWRNARMRRQAAGQGGPRPTMPRLGKPGTITADQIEALRQNHFEPSRDWSAEEAALILAGATYARAVLRDVTGRRDHPVAAQNETFTFIMADEALRTYIVEWARNLSRLRPQDPVPPPRHNEHYERVAAFVRGLPDK
jgi:hypothetical protein